MPSGPSDRVNVDSEADRIGLLVDAVTDQAITMLDREGRVASWNSGAERLSGYAAAEIIGQSCGRCFTLDDQHQGLPSKILEKRCQLLLQRR